MEIVKHSTCTECTLLWLGMYLELSICLLPCLLSIVATIIQRHGGDVILVSIFIHYCQWLVHFVLHVLELSSYCTHCAFGGRHGACFQLCLHCRWYIAYCHLCCYLMCPHPCYIAHLLSPIHYLAICHLLLLLVVTGSVDVIGVAIIKLVIPIVSSFAVHGIIASTTLLLLLRFAFSSTIGSADVGLPLEVPLCPAAAAPWLVG